jgi:2-deoxystreptamine N-acetyl-D-glucosaminyltransferase/2-deoxystreptamine glucosyltransferase
MALQVPPVAFRVGGLPELVVDGETGLLVPAGDLHAFADAAAALVTDPALRARLGAAGPARAALFSVSRMVEGASLVYERVMRATRRRVRR